jgi:hypothetical protein
MQASRVLLVKPGEAYVGGQLYLSGSGFLPHVRETITFACPDAQRAVLIKNGTIEQIQGPITDDKGNFVRYSFRFSPIPQVTSAIQCSVYANYGSNFFGVDIPGTYTVVPTNESLGACSLRMCSIGVRPMPERVHAGLYEVITISDGWGGALAAVSVSYAGVKSQFQPAPQRQELDWKGTARFKFLVPTRVTSSDAAVAAKVTVRVRLGAVTGSSRGYFTVIR